MKKRSARYGPDMVEKAVVIVPFIMSLLLPQNIIHLSVVLSLTCEILSELGLYIGWFYGNLFLILAARVGKFG